MTRRDPTAFGTAPAAHLAHYEIVERIGDGGMGVVYRARDRTLGRSVALKVLRPELNDEPERRSRFLREARAAAALNHPNIATLYEIGSVDVAPDAATALGLGPDAVPRLPYIAMELVEGGDLGDLVRDGPLTVDRALHLTVDILSALEEAHAVGVIHRDLKPANVMITSDGTLKLLDFGLAKIIDGPASFESSTTQLTLDGMVMGTLPYVAPEQLQGDRVDARADLFSLGMLLYEMLVGRTPLPDSSMVEYAKALLLQEIEPPSVHRPEVPAWLDELVMRLLTLEADQRQTSATEVREEIERHRDDARRAEMTTAVVATISGRPTRRWLGAALVALGGILATVTVGGVAWWQTQRQLDDPAVALELGVQALRDGELEQAQVLLARAVELDVNDPDAWYLLGEAYRLRHRPEFAAASFDQARKIHRDRLAVDPDSLTDLAWSSYFDAKGGRCVDALEALDGLERSLGPRQAVDPDLLITRARTYAVCGVIERAAPLIERARALGARTDSLWAPELARLPDRLHDRLPEVSESVRPTERVLRLAC